jgi:hypothetical protein
MGEAKENFDAVVARLTEAGLPIPTPLKSAIAGEFQRLALDTRERWPVWARERGYSDAQIATLHRAVRRIARHPNYLEALAADLSERFDVEGNAISREDRLTASNMILVRAMKAAPKALRPSQSRQPQTAAPAPRRPTITLSKQVVSNG